MCVSFQSIYLITDLGEAFKGKFKQFKSKRDSTSNNSPSIDMKKSSFTKFLNKQECVMIKVQRIPNIYRAISVVCDVKDKNCAVIQVSGLLNVVYRINISYNYCGCVQHIYGSMKLKTFTHYLYDIQHFSILKTIITCIIFVNLFEVETCHY